MDGCADRAQPSSRNYEGNWVRGRWDSAVAIGAGAYLEIEGNLPSVNADRAIEQSLFGGFESGRKQRVTVGGVD